MAAVVLAHATAAQSVPADDYVWAAACKDCHSVLVQRLGDDEARARPRAIVRGRADC